MVEGSVSPEVSSVFGFVFQRPGHERAQGLFDGDAVIDHGCHGLTDRQVDAQLLCQLTAIRAV